MVGSIILLGIFIVAIAISLMFTDDDRNGVKEGDSYQVRNKKNRRRVRNTVHYANIWGMGIFLFLIGYLMWYIKVLFTPWT